MRNIFVISIMFVIFILITLLGSKKVRETFVSTDMKDIAGQSRDGGFGITESIAFGKGATDASSIPVDTSSTNKTKTTTPDNRNVSLTSFGKDGLKTKSNITVINRGVINKKPKKNVIKELQDEKYIPKTEISNYVPDVDMSKFIKKTELHKYMEHCPKMPDMTKYVLKSSINANRPAKCPSLDKYVLKSSVPPPPVCKKCPKEKKCQECNHKEIIDKYKSQFLTPATEVVLPPEVLPEENIIVPEEEEIAEEEPVVETVVEAAVEDVQTVVEQPKEVVSTFVGKPHPKLNNKFKNEFRVDYHKTSAGNKLEPYDVVNTCNIYKRVNPKAKVLGPY